MMRIEFNPEKGAEMGILRDLAISSSLRDVLQEHYEFLCDMAKEEPVRDESRKNRHFEYALKQFLALCEEYGVSIE
jgi:hypothetical protein